MNQGSFFSKSKQMPWATAYNTMGLTCLFKSLFEIISFGFILPLPECRF